MGPVIHWFRRDLRLADNPALAAAVRSGRPVIAVYIDDDVNAWKWRPGGASRWWLSGSLYSLNKSLKTLGGRLILKRGDTLKILPKLIEETGAEAIYWTRCYERAPQQLESQIHRILGGKLEIKRFGGSLLFEPEQLKTATGQPFKVFTPFWKACLRMDAPRAPLAAPKEIKFAEGCPESDRLENWGLLPTRPDWAGGLRKNWNPGETRAWIQLNTFLDGAVVSYKSERNRPDRSGTSRLSPHLHFGEIGPRQVWHALKSHEVSSGQPVQGGGAFLRELGWREFCYHLLAHWPELPEQPFRPEFAEFPWENDPNDLAAWQKGQTGYPIVDAGMRELWHTGWMHNRVRMIAASFLVKDLLIPWQLGEQWFWDTLVDADLANNSAGWQWVAGCGADAAPYFRVFNPSLQGAKFDPDGTYVRRWIPELARMPAKFIHEPWNAPPDILATAKVCIGESYPPPLVDHHSARQRALDLFSKIKKGRR